MLVLKRRIGESVVINGNIVVYLLGMKQGEAKLGFDAPLDVVVDKMETHQQKLAALAS